MLSCSVNAFFLNFFFLQKSVVGFNIHKRLQCCVMVLSHGTGLISLEKKMAGVDAHQ